MRPTTVEISASRLMITTGLAASVPAAMKCALASTNTAKLSMCTRRQTRLGIRLRSSDVISTAASIQKAMTPTATAAGLHELANGTSTSTTSNVTKLSTSSAAMCTPTNSTARPPSIRWTSRTQGRDGRLPCIRPAMTTPKTTDAARRA